MPSRDEPFGITALEGWVAGNRVVASQNGGLSEFIWHNVTGLKVYATPEPAGWGLGTLFTNFGRARWTGGSVRRAAESAFGRDTLCGHERKSGDVTEFTLMTTWREN